MREYQPRTVHELAACTCDRCKRRMTPEDGEWYERFAFDHTCGFDSIFDDGNTVSLDLCQHCAREVLGEWLRITPPKGGDPLDVLRGSVLRYDAPTKSVAWAEYLASGSRATSDFMAEGRDEHEQDERRSARRLTTLKGSIRKRAKPVSVEDMNTAIAEEAGKAARRFGGLKGRVRVQQDFDAPLSLSPASKKKLKKRP